jgi:hypothetical protein
MSFNSLCRYSFYFSTVTFSVFNLFNLAVYKIRKNAGFELTLYPHFLVQIHCRFFSLTKMYSAFQKHENSQRNVALFSMRS